MWTSIAKNSTRNGKDFTLLVVKCLRQINIFSILSYKDGLHSKEFKKKLEILEFNAKHTILERKNMGRDVDWYKRHTFESTPPIYISSTEGIGTPRVRTNHIDAALDYFDEQEKLKLSGARIF